MALAMAALLAGLWAGLVRIGWAWPALRPTLPISHGPLMISGFLLIWRKQTKENKVALLLFFILSLVWIIVSSARAGGDQWDNPRYRSLFLVWMTLLAGWSWVETQLRRSPWLWRLLLLEFVYIGFFIHWYLSRYYDIFKRMDFWPMVKLLATIGTIVIFGGLIFDLIYNKLCRKPDQINER